MSTKWQFATENVVEYGVASHSWSKYNKTEGKYATFELYNFTMKQYNQLCYFKVNDEGGCGLSMVPSTKTYHTSKQIDEIILHTL